MGRDPALTDEEKARLLDPEHNELIPGGPPPPTGGLLDPAKNELIPSEDVQQIEIPELSPGYVEKAERTDGAGLSIDALENVLATTTADPCGFDAGLKLQRAEGGGLRVYKDDRIIRDLSSLALDEVRTLEKYLRGSR